MSYSIGMPFLQRGQRDADRSYDRASQRDDATQFPTPHMHIKTQAESPGGYESQNYLILGGSPGIENGPSLPLEKSRRRRYTMFACIPLSSAIIWTCALIYLFLTYISLPRDPVTGALPRISPVYSIWPYTSCIGSLREAIYKTFAFLVAGLFSAANLIDFYLARNVKTGYWCRRIGTVAGLTSSALLITLVFASENTATHTHLVVTSAKIVAVLTTKGMALTCNYLQRRANPILRIVRVAIISRRWKEAAALLAFSKHLLGSMLDENAYMGCSRGLPGGHGHLRLHKQSRSPDTRNSLLPYCRHQCACGMGCFHSLGKLHANPYLRPLQQSTYR